MPLYAITHTDYVGGDSPHEQADDAAGCIEFFEAENAESASFASRKAEYDACDFKEQLRNGVDSFYDETAVINLDLIFAAMREKGYTVTTVQPGAEAVADMATIKADFAAGRERAVLESEFGSKLVRQALGALTTTPGALLAKWVELFRQSKKIDRASDKEGAHWESLCIGWCMAQGLSVDAAVEFYAARVKSGNHF